MVNTDISPEIAHIPGGRRETQRAKAKETLAVKGSKDKARLMDSLNMDPSRGIGKKGLAKDPAPDVSFVEEIIIKEIVREPVAKEASGPWTVMELKMDRPHNLK